MVRFAWGEPQATFAMGERTGVRARNAVRKLRSFALGIAFSRCHIIKVSCSYYRPHISSAVIDRSCMGVYIYIDEPRQGKTPD